MVVKLVIWLCFFIMQYAQAQKNDFAEELRWSLPADAWPYYKGYTEKGNFLRISDQIGDKKLNVFLDGVKIYDNSKFKGKPFLLEYSVIKNSDGEVICSGQLPFETVQANQKKLICDNFCHDIDESYYEKPTRVSKKSPTSNVITYKSYLHASLYSGCDFKINAFLKPYLVKNGPDFDGIASTIPEMSQNTDSATNFYFKTKDSDFNKGYIKIENNGKELYLDVGFCKNTSFCKFVTIEKSEYEKELEALEKIKKSKSFGPLNLFITELKPCLLKKDKECIKKFFPKPLTEEQAQIDGLYQYKEVNIDDDLIKELLTCLDYKNLMPHLLSMRGIHKACIMRLPDISGNNLIVVDYPEAVRYREDFQIMLVP